MAIKCPTCGGDPPQGSNYQKILDRVEAGDFEAYCGTCRDSWKPSPAEQKLIATNLRRMMAIASAA